MTAAVEAPKQTGAARKKREKPAKPARPPIRLTMREQAVRGIMAIAAALMIGFTLNLAVFSHVQYLSSQQKLRNDFQAQLAEGVAPVSEGDVDNVLLGDGVPVALIGIPELGLESVVVEGTSGRAMTAGPGHRRDTVLPGQAGVSVIMGRSSAYGGPFSRIAELKPRDTFTVITGQGEQLFSVIGVRYPKDPAPAAPQAGESRLVLETSRGLPYAPSGIVRVDAELVSQTQDAGARQTTAGTLPPAHREMATDTSTVWALVFALQGLIVLELALMWSVRRIGRRQIWAVFLPVALLTSFVITDQVIRLLPNLL